MFLMHLGNRFFDLISLNPVLYIGTSTVYAQLEQCNICTTLIMHFQIHMIGSRCKKQGWLGPGLFSKISQCSLSGDHP
jgi:hypothetical protein